MYTLCAHLILRAPHAQEFKKKIIKSTYCKYSLVPGESLKCTRCDLIVIKGCLALMGLLTNSGCVKYVNITQNLYKNLLYLIWIVISYKLLSNKDTDALPWQSPITHVKHATSQNLYGHLHVKLVTVCGYEQNP